MPNWTKKQIVSRAYAEIGYSASSYEIQPEEMQEALEMLDLLAADWNGKGLKFAYPLPGGDSELDAPLNVPDWTGRALYANLALEIAPTIGKEVSGATLRKAKDSYRTLLQRSAIPQQQQFPQTL